MRGAMGPPSPIPSTPSACKTREPSRSPLTGCADCGDATARNWKNSSTLQRSTSFATERGVPRYNRFRELFHKPRVRSFEQITGDPELARELREIYDHPDKVDLMVGMYAEKPPEGFGFSDTAFRVFILMASRRLKSDRFFTDGYPAAVYTQPGLEWIDNNNMTTVLLRHFSELTSVLQRTKNAFVPWPSVAALP
jgi:Animal haem peroxidase